MKPRRQDQDGHGLARILNERFADIRFGASCTELKLFAQEVLAMEDAERGATSQLGGRTPDPLANARDGLMFARGVLIRALSRGMQRGTEPGELAAEILRYESIRTDSMG